MSRILLLYASVGTGHKSAAKALAEAFSADPANEVRIEDTHDYASATFRWLYAQTYLGVTNYAPRLWKLLYDRSDCHDPDQIAAASWLRAAVEHLGVTRLDRLIRHYDPAIVVCTHPGRVQVGGRCRLERSTPFSWKHQHKASRTERSGWL
jgi:processive 1,2-diacylglycerol beta-glucosyltransferase